MYEVDAHNIVPTWVVSDKMEWAARTIRTKVHSKFMIQQNEYSMIINTIHSHLERRQTKKKKTKKNHNLNNIVDNEQYKIN